MDSSVVSAIAAVLNVAAVMITLIYIARQSRAQLEQVKKVEKQIIEARHATWASSFLEVARILQTEDARDARRAVFQLGESDKQFSEWSAADRTAAEIVSHNYDLVGILARWEMIPKEIILDSWADSIRRSWPVCRPLVMQRRDRQKAPEFWDDFEWMYEQATRFDASRARP